MERLIFDSEEMKKIRDLLIDSDAVRCESVSPETPFPGVNSYLLFSSRYGDHSICILYEEDSNYD